MKITRGKLRKIIVEAMQSKQPTIKQQWAEVARIITQVLMGIKKGPIVYSRHGRHDAEIFNDLDNPPHMDKGDEYGNPPMVWIRKNLSDQDPFDLPQGKFRQTTVLEVGSDLHGAPSDVYAEFEIQDILRDKGDALYDLVVKLVGELQ